MLRPIYLPLLLFTISIVCMGQTFQYSRGWTNGKRAASNSDSMTGHFHREEDIRPAEFLNEMQINERRLEKCLQQLQHLLCNPLDTRSFGKFAAGNTGGTNSDSLRRSQNNNKNNVFANHHQSTEFFEDINTSGERLQSDYLRH